MRAPRALPGGRLDAHNAHLILLRALSCSILMQERSMANPTAASAAAMGLDTEFHRGLGLYDSTMVVVGSMIGSGIFIVSADMARNIGSPGWLLGAWLLTGLLTVVGALSYGELAAMMPRAGGQYVYLREAFSPLWGFLYGWTLFLVIQRGTVDIVPGLTAVTTFGLFVAICVSQTGSLFSADAWNNITFTAGEDKDPRRNIPLSLALGTFVVIALYLLANVAYLVTLPFDQIQHAPGDRVATATLNAIFPGVGPTIMAIGIMISTFGCANGLILAGARAYYAMARDRLFFRASGRLNEAKVPAWGLLLQGLWAVFLVLPRTYNTTTRAYGNLYNDLLAYVISAALIFYILTIAGLFRLRRTRPDADRPYRAIGYPIVPALYIAGAAAILIVLFVYQSATTWPGLAIVLLGVPVYFLWKPKESGPGARR